MATDLELEGAAEDLWDGAIALDKAVNLVTGSGEWKTISQAAADDHGSTIEAMHILWLEPVRLVSPPTVAKQIGRLQRREWMNSRRKGRGYHTTTVRKVPESIRQRAGIVTIGPATRKVLERKRLMLT